MMFATPAPGKRVLDPATREPLPAGGKLVPETSYWLRRLRDGDIVAGMQRATESKPKAGKKRQADKGETS